MLWGPRILVALPGLALGACLSTGISADTTCRDYLGYSNEDRAQAVRTIGADLGWRDASNPMGVFAVDAACGASPNPQGRTVGQVIGQWADW